MARYQTVNGQWPEKIPPLTAKEAITAAKRLYRFGMKRKWKGQVKLTSGRNNTWVRWHHGPKLFVNPEKGWHDLVHSLSHYCHFKLFPGHKPHDGRGTHAFLEKTMIDYVVKSGWLEGKLKRPEKNVDFKVLRQKRIEKRLATWESKRRRADTALRKLRRQLRYYEKRG